MHVRRLARKRTRLEIFLRQYDVLACRATVALRREARESKDDDVGVAADDGRHAVLVGHAVDRL
jgi:hypothetical protein